MAITKVYAHVSCKSLEISIAWYAKLFGRKPDTRPMPGLAEWHYGDGAGIQLFEDAGHAGSSTLTLGVTDVAEERSRLSSSGVSPGEIEDAKEFRICRMRDPDQNLVVLAGPKS